MFSDRLSAVSQVISSCSYRQREKEVDAKEALKLFHTFLLRAKNDQKKVYVIGNGGSAGIASHFCIDLLNVVKVGALSLYDSNVTTCLSNDYGFEDIFSRQLEILANPGDLLIAISSSGQSQNILNATHLAKKKNMHIITLSGFDQTNPLRSLGDLNFWLDASDYGLVEMGHFFLLHTIIDSWNSKIFLLQQIIDNANFANLAKD